jgi:hypothetical protein
MRQLLFLILLIALVDAVAADSIPDPDPPQCSCEPWDTNGCVFMTPGSQSDVDNVTIVVRNGDGDPIPGATVAVDVSNCNLCVCVPDGLTGTTDAAGTVSLNPRVGGCDECTVIVRADGVTFRVYTPPGPGLPTVRSTDWDGSNCESAVTGLDFGFFAGAFKQTQASCADYTGDGAVSGVDFSLFAASFSMADACR